MSTENYPSLPEFLAASHGEIAKIAPASMVYAPGGTRRSAVFAGMEPWSNHYLCWAREQTMRSCDLIFQHGVRSLLTPAFTPGNLQEVNRHSHQILKWVDWVLAGPESLADYAARGWRVRLLCDERIPELRVIAERLRAATPAQSQHTLYWTTALTPTAPWEQLLTAAVKAQAGTLAEAMQALYGEEIAPVTLFLAFGKPLLSFDMIPPLLLGQVQCYWSQQPGYSLTETQLRTIFYDYAYLRATWRAEKLERAKAALAHREAWEDGPFLGLGMRLGPFWYPAPMASAAWEESRA